MRPRSRILSVDWLRLLVALLDTLARLIKLSWTRQRLIWRLPREVIIFSPGNSRMLARKLICSLCSWSLIALFFMILHTLGIKILMECGLLILTLISLMSSFTRKASLPTPLTSQTSIGVII